MTEPVGAHPRLTVVIAALDAEQYLGVQLAALARQHCPVPFEVLVCDNGSTDGTIALARSWADRLPVRVVEVTETRGSGPARNAGAHAARGEWLLFCDSDDEVGEGWLAAGCAALAEHSFVAGAMEDRRLNTSGIRRSRPNAQSESLQYLSPGIGLPHGGAGNLGIHQSVFLEVGGFDPSVRYLQDTDLCWRVQLAGYPLVFARDMVVHVRLRPTLRTMYQQGRNFGAAQAALERRHARIPSEPGPEAPRPAGSPLPASGASGPGRSLVARASRHLAWTLTHRVSVGGQMWQLGWHLGHRYGV